MRHSSISPATVVPSRLKKSSSRADTSSAAIAAICSALAIRHQVIPTRARGSKSQARGSDKNAVRSRHAVQLRYGRYVRTTFWPFGGHSPYELCAHLTRNRYHTNVKGTLATVAVCRRDRRRIDTAPRRYPPGATIVACPTDSCANRFSASTKARVKSGCFHTKTIRTTVSIEKSRPFNSCAELPCRGDEQTPVRLNWLLALETICDLRASRSSSWQQFCNG
jgi:hypothetical protein